MIANLRTGPNTDIFTNHNCLPSLCHPLIINDLTHNTIPWLNIYTMHLDFTVSTLIKIDMLGELVHVVHDYFPNVIKIVTRIIYNFPFLLGIVIIE